MSNKPETARQPAKPTDLLPCPFCGKPPTTERITSTAGDSWVWSIQCDGCDVYCSTAAWNTRAGDPAQGEQEPIGYLLEKAGVDNGYYFVEPKSYAHVEERFRNLYKPVYASPQKASARVAGQIINVALDCGAKMHGLNTWNVTFDQEAWQTFAARMQNVVDTLKIEQGIQS